jgi:hypothetical protein
MFKNKAQKGAYEKVGKYLKEYFGEMFSSAEDKPIYQGLIGSAIVNVIVYSWGDDDAVVNVRSCCVMDLDELAPDLLEHLLRENFKFRFGAFSIDPDGDINFEHTIVGSTLDKGELVASVRAVSRIADQYDDIITARWGGVTGLQKSIQKFEE